MLKKIALVLLSFVLMMLSFAPIHVQSSSDAAVTLNDSVDVSFPDYIRFNLKIATEITVEDLRLHYIVERKSYTAVTQEIKVAVPVSSQSNISVNWIWDMRTTGSLPSGTVIRYWWTVSDNNKNLYQSEQSSVRFDDDEYNWQQLNENNVTLHWYYGDDDFAADLMQTCQNALQRLGEDTGAYLESPVRIYIYSSSYALRNAMVFAKEWTGGVAYPAYGVIAIGISNSNIEWGRRALAHELAHLVTHQMTSNPYNDIPVWLNEGISMYAEGELEKDYEYYLKSAVYNDSLISVQSLCSPFSSYSEQSYLSYAESYSIVDYLIEEYGQQKMHQLLTVFKDGSTYNNALLTVYGFDLNALNELWQDYIGQIYVY
jgi:hypothetical protein